MNSSNKAKLIVARFNSLCSLTVEEEDGLFLIIIISFGRNLVSQLSLC